MISKLCLSSFNFCATLYIRSGIGCTLFLSKKYYSLLPEKLVRTQSNKSNIILWEFTKYNITVVCQLMPSVSNGNYYQTFVFHHLIIVPRTIVGSATVVHYFLACSTWHFWPRCWSGVGQGIIILKRSIKYNMTIVCKLMSSFLISNDYQSFYIHHSIILPRTIIGAAIVIQCFLARSTIHFSSRSWSGLNQSNIIQEDLM